MVAFGLFLIVCALVGVVGLYRAYTRYPIQEQSYEPEHHPLPKYRTLREFCEQYEQDER